MVDRSSEGARETWFVQRVCKPAKLLRPRAAEPIRAGGHATTAPKAGHMTASDTQQHAQSPCRTGAIHTCTNEFLARTDEPNSLPRKRNRAPAIAATAPTISARHEPIRASARSRRTNPPTGAAPRKNARTNSYSRAHPEPKPPTTATAPARPNKPEPPPQPNTSDQTNPETQPISRTCHFGPLPSLRSGFGPRAAPAPPSRRLPQDRYRLSTPPSIPPARMARWEAHSPVSVHHASEPSFREP